MLVTKEIKQVWRGATSICFKVEEKQGEITFVKETRDKEYDVVSTVRKSYNSFKVSVERPYKKVYFHKRFANEYGNWKALYLIVKPGDELFFNVFDNSNGYLAHAEIPSTAWDTSELRNFHPSYKGLHCDVLHVSVYRKNKKILDAMQLDDTICPDNTARGLRK